MYKRYCINNVKSKTINKNSIIKYKNNKKSFTRTRKMGFQNVVLYGLNKRGLTSKMETITSSNDIIIRQDIYSQMLVYNLIQVFKQDAEKKIDQTKYKNGMKVNMNMATGFVKKALIKIILEENSDKQNSMFVLLEQK